MNVQRQDDEFLPVDNPISRKNQKKKHEARVGEDSYEIFCCLAQADGLRLTRALRLFKEQQHGEEH